MTTPTGTIRMSDVNVELGRPSNQPIRLSDSAVRNLAGVPGGTIRLSNLRGKSSYTPMTVTTYADYRSYMSTSSGGTASASPSVSVSGGSGGYSYSWSFISNPSGCSMSAGSAPSCSVKKNFVKYSGGSWSATVQCVVTDNTGHSVAVQVDCGADWDSAN